VSPSPWRQRRRRPEWKRGPERKAYADTGGEERKNRDIEVWEAALKNRSPLIRNMA